jgi:hypothetical protein
MAQTFWKFADSASFDRILLTELAGTPERSDSSLLVRPQSSRICLSFWANILHHSFFPDGYSSRPIWQFLYETVKNRILSYFSAALAVWFFLLLRMSLFYIHL